MQYVIIGCGAAGLKAALTIREHDPKGEVIVVSSDLWPLYIKPVLPDFIAGRLDISRMEYISTAKLESLNIQLITGKRVTTIHPEKNTLALSDGSSMAYQFLLIATGSAPVVPAKHQSFWDKLRVLNSLSDAVRIKNESLRSNKAVVIGGGHYALELLRALHMLKFDLTLLTDKEIFWAEDDPISADDVLARLEQEHISLKWNTDLVDIIDLDGESFRIITNDGSIFDTQMILYAPTYGPNITFIQGTTIKTERGILVGEDLRTSIPNVFACGDVAQAYDLNKGLNRINFGWASASKQGEIVGQNMSGRDSVFIPAHEEYFMTLYGQKLLNRW